MKRFVYTMLAIVLAGIPVSALRGVAPGATCESASQHEQEIGSSRRGSFSGGPGHRSIYFDGTHLGRTASISYSCQSNRVASQLITIRMGDATEARALFSEARRSMAATYGDPWKDLDEPTISDLQEGSLGSGLPTRRFVTWVIDERVLSLLLAGEGESWEIVLQGP